MATNSTKALGIGVTLLISLVYSGCSGDANMDGSSESTRFHGAMVTLRFAHAPDGDNGINIATAIQLDTGETYVPVFTVRTPYFGAFGSVRTRTTWEDPIYGAGNDVSPESPNHIIPAWFRMPIGPGINKYVFSVRYNIDTEYDTAEWRIFEVNPKDILEDEESGTLAIPRKEDTIHVNDYPGGSDLLRSLEKAEKKVSELLE